MNLDDLKEIYDRLNGDVPMWNGDDARFFALLDRIQEQIQVMEYASQSDTDSRA